MLALAALLGCGAALADSEYSFTTQPTNVFRGSDNCFVISWETSFTPVKIEIRKWHDGSSETLATVTAASQLRAAMSYPLPAHDDYSSDYYRVLAFYGSGTTDYEWSNSFTLDWDSVDFTSTPTSDFMPSYSDFRVSIPCSFTPVKAEISQNYALVWSGTPIGSYFFVPLSAVYEGSCDLRVYYGDGPYDYVTLYSYRLSWDDVKFVKDAAVGVSPDGTCFRLSWETSFYPTRIKSGRTATAARRSWKIVQKTSISAVTITCPSPTMTATLNTMSPLTTTTVTASILSMPPRTCRCSNSPRSRKTASSRWATATTTFLGRPASPRPGSKSVPGSAATCSPWSRSRKASAGKWAMTSARTFKTARACSSRPISPARSI